MCVFGGVPAEGYKDTHKNARWSVSYKSPKEDISKWSNSSYFFYCCLFDFIDFIEYGGDSTAKLSLRERLLELVVLVKVEEQQLILDYLSSLDSLNVNTTRDIVKFDLPNDTEGWNSRTTGNLRNKNFHSVIAWVIRTK